MKQFSRKMQRLHEIQVGRFIRTETGRMITITEKERLERAQAKQSNQQDQT